MTEKTERMTRMSKRAEMMPGITEIMSEKIKTIKK